MSAQVKFDFDLQERAEMKAIVYHDYGSPDVLKLEEVAQPVPKDDEVLIRVRAASLNPLDWRLVRGEPAMMRVMTKVMGLNIGRPGVDAAGVVETVGKNVTRFKPGDGVFGSVRAACAEYACAGESKVVMKPESVTFAQAASLNVAGLTALQGLRDKGKIQSGQKVLINGAAGGVGTFAVQVAKVFGAEVTGVCSTRNLELIKSIGADVAIDYTRSDFTKSSERYDFIFDCIGNHSFTECRRVLNPRGRHVGVGAPHDASLLPLLAEATKDYLASIFTDQKTFPFIAKASQKDLEFLVDLIVKGKLTPVIDREYDLAETGAALAYLEAGHARGKVIIRVSGEASDQRAGS